MLNRNKVTKRNKLEEEIESVLDHISGLTPGTVEYAAAVSNLDALYKVRNLKMENRIKPEVVLAIAGNLLGIVLIMNHEKANVLSTKALGFVMKGRV